MKDLHQLGITWRSYYTFDPARKSVCKSHEALRNGILEGATHLAMNDLGEAYHLIIPSSQPEKVKEVINAGYTVRAIEG